MMNKILSFVILSFVIGLSLWAATVPTLSTAFRATSGGGYTAYATTFAGDTNCWMDSGGAPLAGSADGLKGAISFWIKFNNHDGVWSPFIYSSVDRIAIEKQANNLIRIVVKTAASVTKIQLDQDSGKVAAITANGTWHWIAASWDNTTAGSAACLYIDGTEALLAGATYAQDNVNLDYTHPMSIGDYYGSYIPTAACVSELWFSFGEYVDFSSSTMRNKFSSGGHPVDLGSTGSTPTGTQPIMYFRTPGVGFITNSGSGGNFTKRGTTAFTTCTAP